MNNNIDDRNYEVTNKIFNVLNDIKGFDVAKGNPRSGKMLTKYNGTTFCITIEPIFNEDDAGKAAEARPFDEIARTNMFLLK